MTITCNRLDGDRLSRCTACTPPDDREPTIMVNLNGVGGSASFDLCDYHRAGLAMILDAFKDDILSEPDEEEAPDHA